MIAVLVYKKKYIECQDKTYHIWNVELNNESTNMSVILVDGKWHCNVDYTISGLDNYDGVFDTMEEAVQDLQRICREFSKCMSNLWVDQTNKKLFNLMMEGKSL